MADIIWPSLDKESQKLITFRTPFGWFKYLCTPYRICSTSEHYKRQTDEVPTPMKDFVDDVVVFDQDEQAHVRRQLLQKCQKSISGKYFIFSDRGTFCQHVMHDYSISIVLSLQQYQTLPPPAVERTSSLSWA